MKSFAYKAAVLALLTTLVAAEPIHLVTREDIFPNATTDKGCYKSVEPLKDMGPWTWQSNSYCQMECLKKKKSVMALFKGRNCFCGDKIPAESEKTTADKCQEDCKGWPDEKCGGKDAYSVLLTGFVREDDVPVVGGKTSTDGSTSTTNPAVVTQGETVVVTSGAGGGGGGPNKAGIAAGVVVGVVVLGALIGGGFFFMKYKKRKAVEEEYRRNATISSFVAGGKPYSQSSTDSRLDPSMMSQRRQSNGSIADDQDFSRRILKVTNPDGSHY
ncbi:hypothetical protein FQN55_005315 [Onygenales sp. PD_40]|nr:hypothetical protein FQN55_005315 [Onygenales sp. PD_40]KAK2779824.1 hypothetical protein FQN53_001309 [Emmonsiellopsis sp. PD_33]KAK2793907.1 hypothetical protein FQN52_000238 [Onygenales sp. PD_12]